MAVAFSDGSIHVYQPKSGNLISNLSDRVDLQVPCTSMIWRRTSADGSMTRATKNILIATYADGRIIYWHTTTGQALTRLHESNNQVLGIDYNTSATQFVTAGSDCVLRLYDEKTKQVSMTLRSGKGDKTAGHSNRVFSVKFHPTDPNMLVSGGWDNTLEVWDTRVQYAVRSMYGPHICGEAVDFDDAGNRILTGSYSKDNQLQIWSFQSGEVTDAIPWSIVDDRKPCLLYSAQFSHGKGKPNRFILGGGGGPVNETKLFNTSTKKCAGMVHNIASTVYTTAISYNEDLIAFGGSGKSVCVFEIENILPQGGSATGSNPNFVAQDFAY